MNSTTITTGMDTKGTLRGTDRGSDVSGPTEAESTMNSPKRIARIAGILYLLVAVFSTFAITFVRGKVYFPSDAAATLGNVVANSGLVRVGVVIGVKTPKLGQRPATA